MREVHHYIGVLRLYAQSRHAPLVLRERRARAQQGRGGLRGARASLLFDAGGVGRVRGPSSNALLLMRGLAEIAKLAN